MNIEEKKARIATLKAEILERQVERRQLEQEINEEESRFKLGDEISFKHGKTERVGRINKILDASWSDHSYIVIPKRKDGSDGSPVILHWFDAKNAKLID